MKVTRFVELLHADFFTGVPDSKLKALCNYLMKEYGTDAEHHIIAANEGNCMGIAAGYYLSTGKVPVVYMQNSGEGNAINPLASLLNKKVYAIPCLLVIGWRGEPGVKDEPQHIFQGEITQKLLDDMEIQGFIITKDTTEEEVEEVMRTYDNLLKEGCQAAFLIKKGALEYEEKVEYSNQYEMNREEVIRHVVKYAQDSPVVSTTGKASRELFEIREQNGQGHAHDFLTVGSMGHSSSIALSVALQKKEEKIWCIDGDGAVLMHMGAMAVIAGCHPENLVHVVINNGAHETVGGMPTAARELCIADVAKACGYSETVTVSDYESLDRELEKAQKSKCLCLIEVKCSIESRSDLGRPTTTAFENGKNFKEYLENL